MISSSLIAILAFGMPGGTEWIILLVLGLLIFGRRLPEVGRSLGKGIVEFKKGIKGIEDEIEDASSEKTTEAISSTPRSELPKASTEADAAGPSAASVAGEAPNPYAPKEAAGNGG